jgi:hypothetical protein
MFLLVHYEAAGYYSQALAYFAAVAMVESTV